MLVVILLAGGRSQRMGSTLPKVLHSIGGQPLLAHLIKTVLAIQPNEVFVIYNKDIIFQTLNYFEQLQWILQPSSLGTGHAVAQALPYLAKHARVLIIPGDTPLIKQGTLLDFIQKTPRDALGIITTITSVPEGMGRIVRDAQHRVMRIVEEKDATATERQLQEVNGGIYLLAADLLKKWIPFLSHQNAQQEYYLTDIIAKAVYESIAVQPYRLANFEEIQGVNTPQQLTLVKKIYQSMQVEDLLKQGVQLHDPGHVWLHGTVTAGKGVVIDHNVTFEGKVHVGDNSYIGPYTILRDVTMEANVVIEGHCVMQNVVVQKGVKIGPFAHIHNKVQLMQQSTVGNFVEITRSTIGEGSKIKHLSYLGDVMMGKKVNIGAGTITCNYDGRNKHKTYIQDEAHVGSLTAIIAPKEIGAKATIGAGSVITQDAPADRLTLSRSPQVTVEEWQRKS